MITWIRTVAISLAVVATFDASAQQTESQPNEAALTSKDVPKDVAKPFDWELGDKAVVVKGSNIVVSSGFSEASVEKWKPFTEYSVNAQYAYDGSDRIADVTLGPAVTRSTLKPNIDADCENQPFPEVPASLWTAFGHLRGRYADIDNAKEVTDYRTAVLAGVGGRVRMYPGFLETWQFFQTQTSRCQR